MVGGLPSLEHKASVVRGLEPGKCIASRHASYGMSDYPHERPKGVAIAAVGFTSGSGSFVVVMMMAAMMSYGVVPCLPLRCLYCGEKSGEGAMQLLEFNTRMKASDEERNLILISQQLLCDKKQVDFSWSGQLRLN